VGGGDPAHLVERRRDGGRVASRAPPLEGLDLVALRGRVDHQDGVFAIETGREWRRRRLGEAVDSDDGRVAALDPPHALGVALDERALELVDARECAARFDDPVELGCAASTSSRVLASITVEPSKMSPYSSRRSRTRELVGCAADHC